MKVTNKITGTLQEFEFRTVEGFSTENDYINYVVDIYMKNPWALDEYHHQVNQVEHTSSLEFMNTVCKSLQAHKRKAFMPDFILRKHQALHCEINKLLRRE